ncbi:class I SAM-dependent methyltransferase [Acetobacter sp.]|uniref:class I SAM-dependent methyltransferase n=1 Tax=Acetobacter sp. TaxID=440 RepID=UPI0039E737D1
MGILLPRQLKIVSLYFRKRRNRRLCELIGHLYREKGKPIDLIDIGGSLVFWLSIPEDTRNKCSINMLNLPGALENLPPAEERLRETVKMIVGDARDLRMFSDQSFDMVVCNSVIEHVGNWLDMRAAANEARRVGKRGWIQVPAFEFPLEQHFLLPFIHWLADPLQVNIIRLFRPSFKVMSVDDQYMAVYHTRPLTRAQFKSLLPNTDMLSERFFFSKSHVATW